MRLWSFSFPKWRWRAPRSARCTFRLTLHRSVTCYRSLSRALPLSSAVPSDSLALFNLNSCPSSLWVSSRATPPLHPSPHTPSRRLPSPLHFPRFVILWFSTTRRDLECNIKAIHNLQHVLSSISMLCPSRRLPLLLFHCSRMSFSCLKGYLSLSRALAYTGAHARYPHALLQNCNL